MNRSTSLAVKVQDLVVLHFSIETARTSRNSHINATHLIRATTASVKSQWSLVTGSWYTRYKRNRGRALELSTGYCDIQPQACLYCHFSAPSDSSSSSIDCLDVCIFHWSTSSFMFNNPAPCTKLCLLSLSLSCAVCVVLGKLVNVTVDDQSGDSLSGTIPTYTPASKWAAGPQCNACSAQPDPSRAFNGTWHDSTNQVGDRSSVITYNFTGKSSNVGWKAPLTIGSTGTTVYAFFILANKYSFAGTSYTSLSFMLDDQYQGPFNHQPDQVSQYYYNVSMFAKADLDNKEHTIVIYNNAASQASLILFDYLVYT